MERPRIPWLLPHQARPQDPNEFNPAFDYELAGTQDVRKEITGIGVNAIGLVFNTVKVVGKLPCLAVAPEYSQGIADDGKGLVYNALNIVGCALKTVGKSGVNVYDWAVGYTLLDVSKLHYSSDEIKTYFANGTSIYELADMIREGSSTSRCVGPIRCVWHMDRWYTLDSQKLWSIKQAGVKQCVIQEVRKEKCALEWNRVFTTTSKGRRITVKGDRPPSNVKPISLSLRTRNTLQCSAFFPDKKKKQSSTPR